MNIGASGFYLFSSNFYSFDEREALFFFPGWPTSYPYTFFVVWKNYEQISFDNVLGESFHLTQLPCMPILYSHFHPQAHLKLICILSQVVKTLGTGTIFIPLAYLLCGPKIIISHIH